LLHLIVSRSLRSLANKLHKSQAADHYFPPEIESSNYGHKAGRCIPLCFG